MNYSVLIKFSNELLESGEISDIIKYNIRNIKKKGLKVVGSINISVGYNEDDFIHNIKTCILKLTVYKKPRFIK